MASMQHSWGRYFCSFLFYFITILTEVYLKLFCFSSKILKNETLLFASETTKNKSANDDKDKEIDKIL